MKPYFLLVVLCFLCENQKAFAAKFPFIAFTKDSVTSTINGQHTKDLTCRILLTKTWPYPTNQATYPCYIATTACLAHGLIRQQQLEETEETALKKLSRELMIAKNAADLQVLACQLAIESTWSGKSLIEAAGYPSTTEN
jgi:hypothetical protein